MIPPRTFRSLTKCFLGKSLIVHSLVSYCPSCPIICQGIRWSWFQITEIDFSVCSKHPHSSPSPSNNLNPGAFQEFQNYGESFLHTASTTLRQNTARLLVLYFSTHFVLFRRRYFSQLQLLLDKLLNIVYKSCCRVSTELQLLLFPS